MNIPGKSQILLPLLVLFCLYINVKSQDCPSGQIKHTWNNKTKCCEPVFNCPKDHEIIPCTEIDGTKDECRACQDSKNYHVTSSVDPDWMKYRCFKFEKDRHGKCSPEDHIPFSDSLANCALFCECDTTKCFHGVPCGCTRVSECGENEEPNPGTGICEACKPHSYKLETGCGPCTWNETSWRLAFPPEEIVPKKDTPSTSGVPEKPVASPVEPGVIVTTNDGGYKIPEASTDQEPKTSESSDGDKKDEEGGAPVGLIATLIILLVVGALCLACFLVIKRKIKDGNNDNRLVILYKKLPCVNSTQSVARTDPDAEMGAAEQRQRQPQEADAEGNIYSPCPTATVKPMVHENGNHTANGGTENGRPVDTIPYTDLPMEVHTDEHNDSCTPLMSSDGAAVTTDVKSAE